MPQAASDLHGSDGGRLRRRTARLRSAWVRVAVAGVVAIGLGGAAVMFPGVAGVWRVRAAPGASLARVKLADSSFAIGMTSGYTVSQVNAWEATMTFVVPTQVSCQPSQACTVNIFWVGIYGTNSSGAVAIAQDGIGISCANGRPTFFPWMNTDAAVNAQFVPSSDPVMPGDTITAEVWANDPDGDYVMEVNDSAQAWVSFGDIFNGPVGQASASYSAESYDGGVQFPPVPVTNAEINGSPIGQYNLQAWEEAPSLYGGTAGLDPTPLDASGSAFTFAWNGPVGSSSSGTSLPSIPSVAATVSAPAS